MNKFHISKNGSVEVCKAKVKPCPLGSVHFESKEAGEKYLDNKVLAIEAHKEHVQYDSTYSTLDANRRGAFVAEETKQALDDGKASYQTHFDEKNGSWDKERDSLHQEILSEFKEKYEHVPTDKNVIFSAGLPGAGKTTVLTQYENLNMEDWATVSSDDMKEILAEKGAIPEIEGLSPMERSTLVHQESSYLADRLLKDLSSEGKNVIYDFTCKNKDSTEKRIKTLVGSGYKTEDMQFTFVDITIEVAKERAKSRYTKGLNESIKIARDNKFAKDDEQKPVLGGRYLPNKVIELLRSEGGKHNSVNAETLISLYQDKSYNFPEPKIYDNSGDEPKEISFKDFL